MNNETHKPTLDLSEIRKEVGDALWLLVAYADMAAKGCSASDDDLACLLGTSTIPILRWKIKLIKTGLISVEQAQSGQTIIVVPRDVVYANGVRRSKLRPPISLFWWFPASLPIPGVRICPPAALTSEAGKPQASRWRLPDLKGNVG